MYSDVEGKLIEAIPIMTTAIKNIAMYSLNQSFKNKCLEMMKVDNIFLFEGQVFEKLQQLCSEHYNISLDIANKNSIYMQENTKANEDFEFLTKFTEQTMPFKASDKLNFPAEVGINQTPMNKEVIKNTNEKDDYNVLQNWEKDILSSIIK